MKPLNKRGLIEVTIDPAEKRGRLLKLTSAGETLLKAAVPIWEHAQNEVEQLTKGGAERLRAGLRALS